MDVAGTAVGIASLGIQVCQSILSYYDGWKGYHEDIRSVHGIVVDLAHTLILLKSSVQRVEAERVGRVITSLCSCEDGLLRLQKRAEKLRGSSEPQTLRQKTWIELQRAYYPFRSSTLAKLREEVAQLREHLALALQVVQFDLDSVSRDKLNDIDAQVGNILASLDVSNDTIARLQDRNRTIANDISNLLTGQQTAKYKDVVTWLAAPDPYLNHSSASKRHEPGTGAWLLEAGVFTEWLKSPHSSVLWLSGKAGCGKTILCSTVIEEVNERRRTHLNGNTAFFYFTFSDTQKQTHFNLLRSLATQLSRNRVVFEILEKAYDQRYPNMPTLELLEDVLARSLPSMGEVFLFVDALDEAIDEADGQQDILNWLDSSIRGNARLKLFVTSRQLPGIESSMSALNATTVTVPVSSTNADIRQYVRSEIAKSPRLRAMDSALKQRIAEVFEQRADGMFRWADCQLSELKRLKSTRPNYVLHALERLPRTLDATYERMLTGIDPIYRPEALRALRWLAYAPRPLTLGQLSELCIVDPEEGSVRIEDRGPAEGIVEILSGLVDVQRRHPASAGDDHAFEGKEQDEAGFEAGFGDARDGLLVRLAHFSVKEYLESRAVMGGAAEFALVRGRERRVLAQTCLVYLTYHGEQPLGQPPAVGDDDPAVFYAAWGWFELLHGDALLSPAREISLLASDRLRSAWLLIWKKEEMEEGRPPSALYCACERGLYAASEYFIQQGHDVNAVEGIFGTPIQAASFRGHTAIVRLLLENRAKVNVTCGLYNSALQAAAYSGHVDVVRSLLEHEADVAAVGGRSGTALVAAISEAHVDVVELLCEYISNLEEYCEKSLGGIMGIAARGPSTRILEIMLSNGVDTEGRWGGLTALQYAMFSERWDNVKLLVKSGCNVNPPGGLPVEPYSRGDIVKLLLEKGADISGYWLGKGRECEAT